MAPRRRAPLRSRLLLGLAGALAVVVAPLAVAAPAQAHNQLIDANPAAGSAVKTAPARYTLTFNEEVENLPGSDSNQIVVTSRETGKEVTEGKVKIDGAKLSRALKPLPAGTYDVQWSALSADGHRVSDQGNDAFTVTVGEKAPAASSSAAATSSAPTSQAGEVAGSAGSLSPAPSSPAATATSGSPTVLILWIVGGFLVLAIILGIIISVTRKKPGKEH